MLLDLIMPDLDGFDTLAAIRRDRPSQRVVLMSGSTEVDIRERTRDSEQVIPEKPFTYERLGDAIDAALCAPPPARCGKGGALDSSAQPSTAAEA